jgi:hypothetical protein
MAGQARRRGDEREAADVGVPERSPIPIASVLTPSVARVLALQGSAGNAAVAQMLARQGSALAEDVPPPPAYEDEQEIPPPPPPLFGEDEHDVPPPPAPEEELDEEEEDGEVPPPPELAEDEDVPPPPPEQEQEVAEDARIVAGNPVLAAAVLANAPEVLGLEPDGGAAAAPAAPAASPTRWQRFKGGVKSVGQAIGSVAGRGLRALASGIGAIPGGIVATGRYVVRAVQGIDRYTVRDGAVTVAKLGLQPIIGAVVPAAKMAMEGTRQVITSVPFVQLPVSLIGSVFDGRSLLKSIDHARNLAEVESDARAGAAAPEAEGTRELLPSLRAAKRIKWRKAAVKGLATAGGVLGIAAAAALLASNPVGWALAIAATAVAAGTVIYRLAHNHRQKLGFAGEQQRRERIADALLTAARGGRGERDLAVRAAAELGVDLLKVPDDEARRRMVAKLKI